MALGIINAFYTQDHNRFFFIKVNDKGVQSFYGTNWRIWALWHQLKFQFQRCCSNVDISGGDRNSSSREIAVFQLRQTALRAAGAAEDQIQTASSLEVLKTYHVSLSTISNSYLRNCFKKAHEELVIRERHLKRVAERASLPGGMQIALTSIQDTEKSIEERLGLIRTFFLSINESAHKTICLNELKIALVSLLEQMQKNPSLNAMPLDKAIKQFSEMHEWIKLYSDVPLVNHFLRILNQYSAAQEPERKESEEKIKEEERGIPETSDKLIQECTKQLDALRRLHDIIQSIPDTVDNNGIRRIDIAHAIVAAWDKVYNPATQEINGEIMVGLKKLFVERTTKKPMTVLLLGEKIGSGTFGTVLKVNNLSTRIIGALKYGHNVHAEAANLGRLRELGIRGVQPEPFFVTRMKLTIGMPPVFCEAMVGKLYRVTGDHLPNLYSLIRAKGLTLQQQKSFLAQTIAQYRQIRGKVYHRDIKPENFFVDEENEAIALGDWAGMREFRHREIAHFSARDLFTNWTPACTPQFVLDRLKSYSPEKRSCAALYHDRFAIGTVLFMILTGSQNSHDYMRGLPVRFKKEVLDSTTAPLELKKYIEEVCSLTPPGTVEEFWAQEKRLDELIQTCVDRGELPAIPTYS